MIEIKGKYANAKVFTDLLEDESYSQILNILNQPFSRGEKIRVMPDVHVGKSGPIGFTSTVNNGKICPNLISVDIGCGVLGTNMGSNPIDFQELDNVIRDKVPSGMNVNAEYSLSRIEGVFATLGEKRFSWIEYKGEVDKLIKLTGQRGARVWGSLGTLGGGNHFISINQGNDKENWLVVHTGSRNFGLKIAEHFQRLAAKSMKSASSQEYKDKFEYIKQTTERTQIGFALEQLKQEYSIPTGIKGLEYLEEGALKDYLHAVDIAQIYSQINRRMIVLAITDALDRRGKYSVESIHNYYDVEDSTIRKGAIAAKAGQEVLIPLNMKDGVILGIGLGNEDWNCSAPHGAGRKMSRSKAKETLSLEEFQETMEGVWSSCVGKDILDEAPAAYKNAEDIIKYLKPSVQVIDVMKEIYNFKASY
jgi:tRNA-splicing ligase RtcB (3'-phosphate/5'-hydroxy nucleic acid ligase)